MFLPVGQKGSGGGGDDPASGLLYKHHLIGGRAFVKIDEGFYQEVVPRSVSNVLLYYTRYAKGTGASHPGKCTLLLICCKKK